MQEKNKIIKKNNIILKYSGLFRSLLLRWQQFRKSRRAAFLNLMLNLALACITVLPLIRRICTEIHFTFEANDDSAVQQILDGSFTGRPEAHAIFVKYPLSWVISRLYSVNPRIKIGSLHLKDINWYLAMVIILYSLALTAVLFRILTYLRSCRLLICLFYYLGFLFIWLPCLVRMTFSTSAAFFGCMSLLFLAFCSRQEAWRPWNLLILGILLTAAYCMRAQCLYMVLPFLLLEILRKYHIHFFKSVKPWLTLVFCGLLLTGMVFLNSRMYGSQAWKRYLVYNHARAYMQDYAGFPEYEENRDLYQSLGISENERNAIARYSYCLVDDFSTDWIEDLYQKLKKDENPSYAARIKEARPAAAEYLKNENQTDPSLKKISFYFWVLIIPLYILTALFCSDYHINKKALFSFLRLFRDLIFIIIAGTLVWLEWIYLAINGRFPQRVEEAIRLLTLTVGMIAAGHLLYRWREKKLLYLPVLLQLIPVLLFMNSGIADARLKEISHIQKYYYDYAVEKSEVVRYCGNHPENCYILDASGFTKGSRPFDDLSQGNWFMSGTWSAYSPLYDQKLQDFNADKLGKEFVTRDNVFIITKGRKDLSQLMALPEQEEAEKVIVDEIATSANTFFIVYHVNRIIQSDPHR